MKTIILLLSTLTAFCAPAPRGVRLVWDHNPPEEQIIRYRLFVRTGGTNDGLSYVTNWTVAGTITNLALIYANREPSQADATNAAISVQRMHWTTTNYPPQMWFAATAVNESGESDYSQEAYILATPLTAPGIRVREFYTSTEHIEVTWPDLPQWSQIQTSDDLVGWTNVVSIQFSYSAMQTERPFNLTFSHYVTNAPHKFWRKINLIED